MVAPGCCFPAVLSSAKRQLAVVVVVVVASTFLAKGEGASAFIIRTTTRRLWRIDSSSCDYDINNFAASPVALTAKKKRDDSTSSSSSKGVSSSSSPTEAPDPLTKASWYAVEAFGKVFGSNKKSSSAAAVAIDYNKPPTSVEETIRRIQVDNDREYFLSGQIDELIYDTDCTFADPFVSFQGRDRFVKNLQNLGSFITKYSAKPLNYQVEENVVETRFMVKLELNLPWKPVLAWPWGVRCEIDPNTNLIVQHQEKWDVEAWEGVKQIFRKPTVQV